MSENPRETLVDILVAFFIVVIGLYLSAVLFIECGWFLQLKRTNTILAYMLFVLYFSIFFGLTFLAFIWKNFLLKFRTGMQLFWIIIGWAGIILLPILVYSTFYNIFIYKSTLPIFLYKPASWITELVTFLDLCYLIISTLYFYFLNN